MVKQQNHDISPDKNGQPRPNFRGIHCDNVPPTQNCYLIGSVARSDHQDV